MARGFAALCNMWAAKGSEFHPADFVFGDERHTPEPQEIKAKAAAIFDQLAQNFTKGTP